MTLRHDDRCHFHPLLLPVGTEKRATRLGSRFEPSDGVECAPCGTARANCEFSHISERPFESRPIEKQNGKTTW